MMMMKAFRSVLMIAIVISVFTGILPAGESPGDAGIIESEESAKMEIPFQKQHQETLVPETSDESFQFPLYRTVGGLGLVLCLMVALYFGTRKFFPQYFQKASSEQNLKILETLSMGDRRSIALIQVADKRFLIGNTAHQINLLTEISEPIPLQTEVNEPSRPSVEKERKESGNSFRNLFEFEKKRPVPNPGNPLPEDIRTKMRLLREALER
ncbi:MAG: flagellar biosynthetic protein FliO [Acidobacteria bacterium]|nr:flagellar biosynthetic protein FliO [Acidobacteriota bacterium]